MKNAKIVTILFVLAAVILTAKAALGAVYINEIMVAGDEWIELYNDDPDVPVDLTGWVIEDGTGSTYGSGSGSGDAPLDGLSIPTEGYLVLTQGTDFDFQLNNPGDVVVLNKNTTIVDEIAYGTFDDGNIEDNEPAPGTGEVLARESDGSATWVVSNEPTPNGANKPLEISTDSVLVTVEGKEYDLSQEINVSPGDTVKVNFEYENNLDEVAGYVTIHAESDQNPEFEGLPYEMENWVLLPEIFTASDEFEFTVYENVGEQFTITIVVEDEDAQGQIYSDTIDIMFTVVKEAKDVVIKEAYLGDENLTCTKTTTLGLKMVNTGKNDLLPEVMVYNQEIIDVSYDAESGEAFPIFNTEPTLSVEYMGVKGVDEILPGQEAVIGIPIDVAGLAGPQTLYIYAINPFFWNSEDGFYAGDEATVEIKEIGSCLDSVEPEDTNLIIGDGEPITLSVTLNEEGYNEINWYVDEELVYSGEENYTFSEDKTGEYLVKVSINANSEEEHIWTITVTDVPLSDNLDLSEDGTTLENPFAEVVFDEAIDFGNLVNLDEVIIISDSLVAIDAEKVPGLNKPATITLKKTFTNHKILKSSGFNEGEFEFCPEDVCQAVSNTEEEFVFTVTGFSTYKVVEDQAADISISNILIEGVDRGENRSVSITVKNVGSYDSLTDLSAELVKVGNGYNAELTGDVPGTLVAGEEFALTLQLTVPEDESSGKHSIGSLKVTGKNGNETLTKTATIYLDPKNHLVIESIKINGKSSGDLSIKEINEIEVKVQNDYTKDMEEVTVTVKLLDVDDDDLEKEAEEKEVDKGDDETFTVEFDLMDEDIDKESYTLEITVEGEATDNSEHKVIETKTVDVNREKHEIVIKKASLTSNQLQCLRQTTLPITVENIGKSNEDDVEIKVKNADLRIELGEKGIELEKYSKDDNDYKTTFNLELEDAAAGTYPIAVEVYRDDHLEDTTELTLELKECLTSSTVSQTQVLAADQLTQELQQYLQAKQQTTLDQKKIVKTSFRDSSTYVMLLGILVVLVFLAAILALAVAVKKKK